MMININYSEIISQAKNQGAKQVNFDNNTTNSVDNWSNKDKLTLSSQAISLLNGDKHIAQEVAPIYVRPQTAAELLDENSPSQVTPRTLDGKLTKDSSTKSVLFEEMMQAILDKRLGVDRKKLEEIEALMKEIAENENLSPEEKAKAMKEIEKMRDKIIQESIEVKKTAKQSFTEPTNDTNLKLS